VSSDDRLSAELEARIREWAEYVGVETTLCEWVNALLEEIDGLRNSLGVAVSSLKSSSQDYRFWIAELIERKHEGHLG